MNCPKCGKPYELNDNILLKVIPFEWGAVYPFFQGKPVEHMHLDHSVKYLTQPQTNSNTELERAKQFLLELYKRGLIEDRHKHILTELGIIGDNLKVSNKPLSPNF